MISVPLLSDGLCAAVPAGRRAEPARLRRRRARGTAGLAAGDPALGKRRTRRAGSGRHRQADDHRVPRAARELRHRRIVAPGGGYGALAIEHEGRQEAYWFNAMGITAFVLKYRLGPRYHHPIELGDAQRAIRTVRARAAEFNIIPGSHRDDGVFRRRASRRHRRHPFRRGEADAADPIERVGSRPDFLILGYPVISFDPAVAHAGRSNLLGDNPDPKLIEDLSNDLRVTAQTPPTFLFHTTNDNGVPVENSVRFYLALRKARVPVEMHLFENGPHGVGMALERSGAERVAVAVDELAARARVADEAGQ